jgi:hypothetical protein
LEDAGIKATDVETATVHRFQGSERQTVIVDLTDSTGCRLGRFMQGVSREDDGWRLLNVAISRAMDHLIVVGNFQYLLSKAPRDGGVVRLLHLLRQNGTPLQIERILPLGDKDWIDGLHKVVSPDLGLESDRAGIFDEASFYPAFAHDLEVAQESILIVSPFITSRGTARWVDHLRRAVQNGIGVRIVTSNRDSEFGGASKEEVSATIAGLRSLGIVVDIRRLLHEKIAVFDLRIAWHGSLNILSHSRTSESMLRLVGESTCVRLLKNFSLPRRQSDEQWKVSDAENPMCADCSAPTILHNGRFGIYFECPECGWKTNLRGAGPRRDRE